MSGPICPDCGLLALEQKTSTTTFCPICGWKGKNPPRKILYADDQSRRWKETQEKIKLREQKKLFYVRIYLEGTDSQMDKAEEKISDYFFEMDDDPGWDQQGFDDEYILYRLDHQPEPKHIKHIKSIKHVKVVTVF
jgi:uncharacterized Zn finger protein (UPF0148 family)